MRTTKIGHLFRTLIDKKNDQNHLRMIFCHGVGDVMQQRCLARARWGDNQTALSHSERRHQIHDPRRVTVRNRLELDSLVWIDRGQFLEWRQPLIYGRFLAIDLQELHQLRAAAAAPGFAVDPHPVAQAETANDFGGYKNILRGLHEVALGIAQETETFARDLDDPFTEFRLGLNLFATFGNSLPAFTRLPV